MASVDDATHRPVREGMKDQLHAITIKAPSAEVWGEITRLQGIHEPMFNTVLETTFEPGSRLLYRSTNGKRVFIIGEVVEFQPPRRLAHTFRFTTTDEAPTLVTWGLSETGEGVRVTVAHTRFTDQVVTNKSVLAAWPRILANYKAVLERGHVPLGTRAKHRLMQAFAFLMPSRSRTETALRLSTVLPTGE